MRPAQVNKLYSKLTPHEQAVLVVEAAARLDEKEIDAIVEQVERKTYISAHADYTQRIHALKALISQYGIEYWKNRTLMLLACEYAEQGDQQAKNTAPQFFDKCMALEAAIIRVCKNIQVDVKAIKILAGCLEEGVKLEELEKANKKLVEQYTAVFAGLIGSDVIV